MSQTLTLHPVLRNDDNLEIAVMHHGDASNPSWVNLVFEATDDGIVMTIAKQKHTDMIIGDGVRIPTVFDARHNVLLSPAQQAVQVFDSYNAEEGSDPEERW